MKICRSETERTYLSLLDFVFLHTHTCTNTHKYLQGINCAFYRQIKLTNEDWFCAVSRNQKIHKHERTKCDRAGKIFQWLCILCTFSDCLRVLFCRLPLVSSRQKNIHGTFGPVRDNQPKIEQRPYLRWLYRLRHRRKHYFFEEPREIVPSFSCLAGI